MNNSVGNSARLLWAGLRALLVLTLVCGVIYPLAVTGIAQGLMPGHANGSAITSHGKVVGSELIGQRYDLPSRRARAPRPPTSSGSSPAPPTASAPTASTPSTP